MVYGLWFGVWGLGLMVYGVWCMVLMYGVWCMVYGSCSGVWGFGLPVDLLWFIMYGLCFGADSMGLRVFSVWFGVWLMVWCVGLMVRGLGVVDEHAVQEYLARG